MAKALNGMRCTMHLFHSTPQTGRFVTPIPGVPDSQTRALDRRIRLHRQLQSYRDTQRTVSERPVSPQTVAE